MLEEKELKSLIYLLDDPDERVFSQVEGKLMELGMAAVEPLEEAWSATMDVLLQERIENLIHRIQFEQVRRNLEMWAVSGAFDLLEGLLIVNRYRYPEADDQAIINQIEAIKRDVWLEMMYSMSAVEQVRLINTIFYHRHGFKGNVKNYHDADNSYIGRVLESKRGNPILLAALYSIVAQRLDIQIYGVNLPKHFILAYVDSNPAEESPKEDTILFYINAFNKGQIFGKHDVLAFLKQLNLPSDPSFFLPCDHKAIIARVLRNLIAAYNFNGATEKIEEIEQLLKALD